MHSEYIERRDGGYYVAGTRISLEMANPALWARIQRAKAEAAQGERRS